MINKIKNGLIAIKDNVVVVMGIIMAVMAAIMYSLYNSLNDTKSKYGKAKVEESLKEILIKKEQDKQDADDAEANYKRVRADYVNDDEPEGSGGSA